MLDISRPLPPAPVRCRQIGQDDLAAVVDLLVEGFPLRSAAYWRAGLARHASRPSPPGCPPYGYMLESAGRPVGVLLTLYREVGHRGRPSLLCELSSWYVAPAFRAQAMMLDKVAQTRKDVTYVNISPAPHTLPLQEVRGFRRYARGVMLAVAALGRARPDVAVRLAAPADPLDDLPENERRLMRDHVSYGCVGLVVTRHGQSEPVIVIKRWISVFRGRFRIPLVPFFHVVYCRDVATLAEISGPVGRRLCAFGVGLMVIDANGPMPGLVGRYFEGRAPKICRGPDPIRLGDLSYSELVVFGP